MAQTNRAKTVALVTVLTFAVASPAQAYLDPGTGTMILQIILGGVAGILVAGKLYWTRLMGFLGLSKGEITAIENDVDTDID
jgi:hypothetical protein